MLRYIWKWIQILAVTLLLEACNNPAQPGPTTIRVTDQSGGCGSAVSLRTGDTLVLALPGNPTTGYKWETTSVAPTVLTSLGEPDYRADSNALGAGGTYTFRFQDVAQGEAALKLIYHRSFEPNTPPVKT